MVTMRLRKEHGSLVLEGPGSPAAMTTNFSIWRGTLTVNGRELPIRVDNPLRRSVFVGPGEAPVLRFDPRQGFVPGSARPVSWQVRRSRQGYRGAVVRGDDRIDVLLPRFRGKSAEVTVTGEWDQLMLVALAACFALLARRRGDTLRAMVIANASRS